MKNGTKEEISSMFKDKEGLWTLLFKRAEKEKKCKQFIKRIHKTIVFILKIFFVGARIAIWIKNLCLRCSSTKG